MAWKQRGERKGAKRLPEKLRRRVLHDHPFCALALPGICTGRSTQVHHICDAADFADPNDPRIDAYDNLTGVCAPCHTKHSAQQSARRSWDWKRKPEKHPGILD